VPQSLLEIIFIIVLTLALAYFLVRQKWVKDIGLPSIQIQGLFVIKVCAGIFLAIFYEIYYGSRVTSDAFRFYDDALIIFESLKTNPKTYFQIVFGLNMSDTDVVAVIDKLNTWYKVHGHGVFNDNQTMIRFNALLLPFSQGYYHVHTVVIAFLSFTGFLAIIKVFQKFKELPKWMIYGIILFPQVIFWSSGVLKEGFLFFCFGWFLYFLFKIYEGDWSKKTMLGTVFFLYLSLLIKTYVIFSLIPGITILLASIFLPRLKSPLVFGALWITLLGLVIMGDSFRGNQRARSIYQKQHDFINEAKSVNAGSFFETFVLEPNWKSVIRNSPEAFFNSITRPMPWNANNLISKMASVENVLVLLLFLIPMIFFKKPDQNQMVFILFSTSFVLIMFTLIGLVTPVAGALVRYKIPGIPFVLFTIYLLTDWQKLFGFFKLSRKKGESIISILYFLFNLYLMIHNSKKLCLKK